MFGPICISRDSSIIFRKLERNTCFSESLLPASSKNMASSMSDLMIQWESIRSSTNLGLTPKEKRFSFFLIKKKKKDIIQFLKTNYLSNFTSLQQKQEVIIYNLHIRFMLHIDLLLDKLKCTYR